MRYRASVCLIWICFLQLLGIGEAPNMVKQYHMHGEMVRCYGARYIVPEIYANFLSKLLDNRNLVFGLLKNTKIIELLTSGYII